MLVPRSSSLSLDPTSMVAIQSILGTFTSICPMGPKSKSASELSADCDREKLQEGVGQLWAATAQAAAIVSPLYAVEGHPFATLAAQMLQIYLNVTAKGCSYPLALGPTGVHSLETQVLLASQTSDCSIMGGQAMSAYSWDDLGLKKRTTNQRCVVIQMQRSALQIFSSTLTLRTPLLLSTPTRPTTQEP